MEKVFNARYFAAATVATLFCTLIAFMQMYIISDDAFHSMGAKLFSLLTGSFLTVFFLNFWVALIIIKISDKLLKFKALSLILSFVLYFFASSVLLYLSLIIIRDSPNADLSFFEYLKVRGIAEYMYSLQYFVVPYAFIRIADTRAKRQT